MIAIILGGAPSVWRELEVAENLLGPRAAVVAANLAGIHYRGRLSGWATLHPDLLPQWIAERGEGAERCFAPSDHWGPVEVVGERWNGSSGLYALQVALGELRAAAAILCGVPMQSEAGHFRDPGPWADVSDYRAAFVEALPLIGGRVRSLGGWTAEVFGRPTREWVAAASTFAPLRGLSPKPRKRDMYKVENVTDTTQTFQAINPDGGFVHVILAPGEAKNVEIDPLQGRFQEGGPLKATPISADAKATVARNAKLFAPPKAAKATDKP